MDEYSPGQIVRVRYIQAGREPEFPFGLILQKGFLSFYDDAGIGQLVRLPSVIVKVAGDTGLTAEKISDDGGTLFIMPDVIDGMTTPRRLIMAAEGTGWFYEQFSGPEAAMQKVFTAWPDGSFDYPKLWHRLKELSKFYPGGDA